MDSTTLSVITLFSAGAAGGVVLGFSKESSYRIKLPGGNRLEIGFIGDAMIGGAASIAVFAFAGPILNIDLSKLSEAPEFIKAIAVSIISGFGGISLLQNLSDNLAAQVKQVSSEVESIKLYEKSNNFVDTAVFYRNNGLMEEALLYYGHALNINPDNLDAMIGKGFTLKRLGRIEEAFEVVDTIIKKKNDVPGAWYNRACYRSMLGHSKLEILDDLKKAIELFPTHKELARKDPDFKDIHDDPEFLSITQMSA